MCRWLDTAGKTVFHWLKSIWHDLQLIEKLLAEAQFSVRLAISVDNYERLVYENVSCKWLLMRDSWSSVINLHITTSPVAPEISSWYTSTFDINWEISQNIQKSHLRIKIRMCNHHFCETQYWQKSWPHFGQRQFRRTDFCNLQPSPLWSHLL